MQKSDKDNLAPELTYLKPTVYSNTALAKNVEVGKRVPSTKVLSQADARPWHLHELLPSNGKWRLVLFVGDVSQPGPTENMNKVAEALAAPNSFLKRFTPADQRYDDVIEVLTIHAAKRLDKTIFDFPEVLRPYHEIDGWDYRKVFVDDQSFHEGHGQLYETFGIDPKVGAAVILRPDQYVAYAGPVEDYQALDTFFSGFMIKQTRK